MGGQLVLKFQQLDESEIADHCCHLDLRIISRQVHVYVGGSNSHISLFAEGSVPDPNLTQGVVGPLSYTCQLACKYVELFKQDTCTNMTDDRPRY